MLFPIRIRVVARIGGIGGIGSIHSITEMVELPLGATPKASRMARGSACSQTVVKGTVG